MPHVSGDFRELLADMRPDTADVGTSPARHLDVVRTAIAAGARAVRCEKPIALGHGDAVAVTTETAGAEVVLTVNLQRRFDPVRTQAHERIAQCEIGDVVTVEGYCPNLFDRGTHTLDLIPYHRPDTAAK